MSDEQEPGADPFGSPLSRFIDGAKIVAEIQGKILDAFAGSFSDHGEYLAAESLVLAPGYDGWEGRALKIIKQGVQGSFQATQAQAARASKRYRRGVPHRDQDPAASVPGDPEAPHIRVYFCLRCGFKVTALALSGICCAGQPECQKCGHVLHEPSCKGSKPSGSLRFKP